MSNVLVVDRQGRPIGCEDKLAAHAPPGTPHLAFSVLLFDERGRLLLQRRAMSKYHFAGLWSNSCCSHPQPGDLLTLAAERRIREELGVAPSGLEVVGAFWYRAADPQSGLVEHEYDVVLRGLCTAEPVPDTAEVSEIAWMDMGAARDLCNASPGDVTPWFAQVLQTATDRSQDR